MEIIVNEYVLLTVSDLWSFKRRLPLLFFIGTLYNSFNKFQFGTINNGIKILVKGVLPNVSESILF